MEVGWQASRLLNRSAMDVENIKSYAILSNATSTYKHTVAALAIIPDIYLRLRTKFKLLSHRQISGVSF